MVTFPEAIKTQSNKPSTAELISVLKPEALKGFDQQTKNKTLEATVRTVFSEGNVKQGIPLLERIVKAGGRVDGMMNGDDDLSFDEATTSYNRLLGTKIMSTTGGKPPRLDEKLESETAIEDYVERLLKRDAVILNQDIGTLLPMHPKNKVTAKTPALDRA
jgi:hypothetical protein